MAKTEEECTIEQMFIDRERLKQEKSFSLFVMCGGVAQGYFSEYFRSTRLKNKKNYGIINIEIRKETQKMLRLSIEELSALNLILQFTTVAELLDAAMKGFAEEGEEKQILVLKEKSDLCWKVLKTLK